MKKHTIIAVALTVGLLCAKTGYAQDNGSQSESARLKKLEQAVGQLQQENNALKQQLGTIESNNATDASQSLNSKILLSAPVKEMQIYGELRLRYFMNEVEVANSTVSGERNRMRYRMRIGDNIKLTDNFMIGVLVEANNSAHSANVTLGNSASTTADSEVFNKGTVSTTTTTTTGNVITGVNPATGKVVVGKQVAAGTSFGSTVSSVNFQDALFFGQVYMKYTPFPWVTLEGGKLPNPFTTSRMVWDPDIYPEGLAEQFKYTIGPWGGHPAGVAENDGKDAKDMKEVQPQEPQGGMTVDLFANFGQFIYEDVWTNNFNINGVGQLNTPQQSDLWQLGFQVGAKANFDKNTSLQVAPTYYTYTGAGNVTNGVFSGDGPTVVLPAGAGAVPTLIFPNEEAVNSLKIIDIPAEFDWKMWNIPFRIFGDFADNLSAQNRANGAGHPDKGDEGKAYQAGVGIGRIKKGGDWELLGYYQRSEQYSLDPNIVDDDIFNGRLNIQGFYLQATYAFTDAFSIVLNGSHGKQIDSSIGTAGSGALGEPAGLPLQEVSQFYIDLSLKF
jgi:hypothetical protein